MISRTFVRLAGVTMLALMAGCSSMSGTGQASTNRSPAIYASRSGNGVIYLPHGDTVDVYSAEGMTSCARCKADAMEFEKTGKMSPVCSACGATRTAFYSHN